MLALLPSTQAMQKHYCPGRCGILLYGSPAQLALVASLDCNRCGARMTQGRTLVCSECGVCNHCGSEHTARVKPTGVLL